MANEVTIVSDTCTLSIRTEALEGAAEMEFRSGSFKGSVPERRVASIFLAIPVGSKDLEMRMEFTDPIFSAEDLFGRPSQTSPIPTIFPYTEPKQERAMDEGR